jgi:outer membrane receptor protein involved in Fe transport
MTKTFRTLSSLLLAFSFLCAASSAFAQGTNLGSIRGVVTDPNGAAVAGAQVVVTDLATNIATELTTGESGNYEAPNLKIGAYRVAITAQGFKTTTLNNVVVRASDTVRADAQLEVGAASEEVSVTSDAGVIQTDTPTISNAIDNRQLTELPRESRDIYSFLFLNPNITQGATEDSFKFIGSQSYGASFSLDGQRANGGIFGGVTASQPSLEVIQELTVLSNNFAAEYGGIANVRVVTKRGEKDFHGSLFYNNRNSALAAWRIQDKIAAANFTPTPALSEFPTPYFNLNEVGGSFSGPVPMSRNRSFFLTSYERRWDYAPVTFRSSNIPTSRFFGGDFSMLAQGTRPAVPAEVRGLLTPAELSANTFCATANTTPEQCATANLRFNQIPQRLLNPIAVNILNTVYPNTGNAPFNPVNGRLIDFYQNMPGLMTRDLFTLRGDHDFSDNDKFYAVYNYQKRDGSRFINVSPLPSFGLAQLEGSNHTLSLSYTKIISPTVVNEARGGFNVQDQYRHGNQTTREFLAGVGFNEQEITSYGAIVGERLLDSFGHPGFTIGSFQAIGTGARNIDRSFDQRLATFGDTLTWVKGEHTFKFGADFVRNQAVDDFVTNRNDPRGSIIYPNNFSGTARFLLGLAPTRVTYVRDVRESMDVHNWETGFFAQDDWKVNPNLTLQLGLRYEVITPFVDRNDLFINFLPEGANPLGNKGVFVVPTEAVKARIHPGFVQYGVVTADEIGVGRGLIETDYNNFAPRLGLAYRINENTVLRGGYGIFYPTSAAQGQRDAFASSSFNQRITKNSTAAAPLAGLPGGINARGTTPFTGGTVQVQGLSINAIPTDLQSPRIQQFNATLERELGWNTGLRVSYLGSRMSGLIAGIDLNLLEPNSTPFGTTTGDGVTPCDPSQFNCIETAADRARRPFPAFGDFLASYGNIGSGRSHALQIEANRRFSRGLTFNVSYTLLDQKSDGLDVGASSLGGTLYNQFNVEGDYARDAFVSRHRAVFYGTYDLPYGRGRAFGTDAPRALDLVAGGWQLTWNGFAKSGTGFTPYYNCDNCSPVFPGNLASGFIDPIGDFNTGGGFRANVVGGADPYLRQGDQFLNPAAFALPSAGADVLDNPNVAKRNFLTGPGTWGANLGLRKFFRFSETTRLEVGADFNNVFNHPLRSPTALINFARVGSFSVGVNPATLQPTVGNFIPNPRFGRTDETFNQEGIENRRLIRLRLRLTF